VLYRVNGWGTIFKPGGCFGTKGFCVYCFDVATHDAFLLFGAFAYFEGAEGGGVVRLEMVIHNNVIHQIRRLPRHNPVQYVVLACGLLYMLLEAVAV
jgi:hypothetical protein